MVWLLFLFNSAIAAAPTENPFRVMDRAPAIDGPATSAPVGENSALYQFLDEVEADTHAYEKDYNSNAHPKPAEENVAIQVGD